MDHQQFIVYYGEVVAKNWSSLLIEVTISRRLFVVMPENGIFCEFNFSNGILWEFSQKKLPPPLTQAQEQQFSKHVFIQERVKRLSFLLIYIMLKEIMPSWMSFTNQNLEKT